MFVGGTDRSWYSSRSRPITWASVTGGPPPYSRSGRRASSRHRVWRTLPARAQHLCQRSLDLVGQIGHGAFGRGASGHGLFGHHCTGHHRAVPSVSRLPDSTTVAALDLTEAPDQVHAAAHLAPVELVGPVNSCLAVRADEHLPVAAYAPAPGTLAPVRVYLPCTAPIAGHPACPDSAAQPEAPEAGRGAGPARELAQLGEGLLIVGDLSRLRDGVNDLPPHDAVLVDDERAADSDAHLVIEDTVGLRDVAVWPEVSEQCEIEMIPLGPRPQHERRIDRNRQQLDVVPRDLRELVPDRAHLAAAHAAEGQRVEHQHNVLAAPETGQADRRAVLVFELEVRGLIADFNRHGLILSARGLWNVLKCFTNELAKARRLSGGQRAGSAVGGSAAGLRCDQAAGRPVAPGADGRGLRQSGGRSRFTYLTGLDVTVTTRFGGKQHDVAAVSQRGERIYQGVDEVTIAVPPPQQDAVHDVVVVLVDEFSALQCRDRIAQRLVAVVVVSNLLHHVAWLNAKPLSQVTLVLRLARGRAH